MTESEGGAADSARFSLTVIKGTGPRKDAEKLAADFLEGLSRTYKPLKTSNSPNGPFVGRAGIFAEGREQAPAPHTIYAQVLVNPNTGTVYVIGFEAPSNSWDEKWKVGQVVTGVFLLDDEI